ncbi:hypothetical protein [Mycolicibacter senuensis]|uniref:hypothetical protein n=1 Tax=Mycolicibacter senuensis TaxID=386913 RepID=UPI001057E503|nr:hypothetical protein [Mycolicibacter senuensis]
MAVTTVGAVAAIAEQECGVAANTGRTVDRTGIFGRECGDRCMGAARGGRASVAAVAEEPPGVAAAAVVAISAAAVTEQQSGISPIGIIDSSVSAVADQILPRHRVDKMSERLAVGAVEPSIEGNVQRSVEVLVEQGRPEGGIVEVQKQCVPVVLQDQGIPSLVERVGVGPSRGLKQRRRRIDDHVVDIGHRRGRGQWRHPERQEDTHCASCPKGPARAPVPTGRTTLFGVTATGHADALLNLGLPTRPLACE